MSYPTISEITSTTHVAETSHVINYPGTVDAGDLLIAIFGCDDDEIVTFPNEGTDWHIIYREDAGNAGPTLVVAWREAAGTEGGGNFTVTTLSAEGSCTKIVRIKNHEDPDTQPPEASTEAFGSDTNPNSLTLTPTGGSKDYLFISAEANDDDDNVTGYPANMADNNEYSQVASVTLGIATEEVQDSVFDPAQFTIAATESWEAVTIAIHPIGATTYERTVLLDVAVQKSGILRTVLLDVAVQKPGIPRTVDLDVAVQKPGIPRTVDLDVALQKKDIEMSVLLDLLIKLRAERSVLIDTVLQKIIQRGVDLDVALQLLGISRTVLLDVAVQEPGIPRTVLLDVALQLLGIARTVLLDVAVQKPGIQRSVLLTVILREDVIRLPIQRRRRRRPRPKPELGRFTREIATTIYEELIKGWPLLVRIWEINDWSATLLQRIYSHESLEASVDQTVYETGSGLETRERNVLLEEVDELSRQLTEAGANKEDLDGLVTKLEKVIRMQKLRRKLTAER